MHKSTSPDSLFPVSSTCLLPINTSNSVYSDLTAISGGKKRKHVRSLKLRRVVSERLARMPRHPSRSSSYARQIQSIPDRWGFERIHRSLVKRGFCSAPGGRESEADRGTFYSVPSWCLPPKGRRVTTALISEHKSLTSSTRLHSQSWVTPGQTRLSVAGRLTYCSDIYCKTKVHDCVHTLMWCQSCLERYKCTYFVQKENWVV